VKVKSQLVQKLKQKYERAINTSPRPLPLILLGLRKYQT